MTLGSEKYLRAAKNAFTFLAAQSYATGGWGPDENAPRARERRCLRQPYEYAQEF